MKKSIFALALLALVSCGGKSGPKVFAVSEENFSKFINAKDYPADPNMLLEKSIVNNDYPIQLALYKDHQFYYDLPNLDAGKGTWSYSNGQIVLKSKHRLFDMRIDIHSLDESGSNVAIKFIDRHGPQTLKMEKSLVE